MPPGSASACEYRTPSNLEPWRGPASSHGRLGNGQSALGTAAETLKTAPRAPAVRSRSRRAASGRTGPESQCTSSGLGPVPSAGRGSGHVDFGDPALLAFHGAGSCSHCWVSFATEAACSIGPLLAEMPEEQLDALDWIRPALRSTESGQQGAAPSVRLRHAAALVPDCTQSSVSSQRPVARF